MPSNKATAAAKTDALQHGARNAPPTGAEKRLGTEHPAGKYGSDTRHGWNSLPSARQPADAGRRRYVGLLDREHRHTDRPGREEMERAAKSLDFLAAAKFRDRMYELQKLKESGYKR